MEMHMRELLHSETEIQRMGRGRLVVFIAIHSPKNKPGSHDNTFNHFWTIFPMT
jgi:hypothetical protein